MVGGYWITLEFSIGSAEMSGIIRQKITKTFLPKKRSKALPLRAGM
jgi:hypothetical protein